VAQAAEAAGAPKGCISCLSLASMAGCQELMAAEEVRLILATGGPAMVKSAYSSGKPAIGVGAGNGPAYIHRSADVKTALRHILRSKTFDNGTVCASEQSILVERAMADQVEQTAKTMGFYFLNPEEAAKVAKLLFRPTGALNPEIVGRTALHIGHLAGLTLPPDTKILVARETGVGAKYPYSMEKLCPVLAFYVEENEDAVLAKAMEILHHEGAGHTFSLHTEDRAVVEKFAHRIPVSRFLVNTPAALGGIGATTNLFPALTLGCGAVGGSASSNNIGPMDLINVRRVAWGTEESQPQIRVDHDLVELLTQKILERLN
jgi:acyl-CoA reductase-like NAD-dependent aldehyde dehydrogenase